MDIYAYFVLQISKYAEYRLIMSIQRVRKCIINRSKKQKKIGEKASSDHLSDFEIFYSNFEILKQIQYYKL